MKLLKKVKSLANENDGQCTSGGIISNEVLQSVWIK